MFGVYPLADQVVAEQYPPFEPLPDSGFVTVVNSTQAAAQFLLEIEGLSGDEVTLTTEAGTTLTTESGTTLTSEGL